MCTEPGLLDPKLSSSGSSEKGDSNEKRVYPPQRSITTYSRKRKWKKATNKAKNNHNKNPTNKQYQIQIWQIDDNRRQFFKESYSFQRICPKFSPVGHCHTQRKK